MKKIVKDNAEEGRQEICILKVLGGNKNVVKLIEVCEARASETFYIVMELCENDLAGLLSNASVSFTLGEIKNVMQQLLSGLSFIHSKKILHRDMKPANILMTKDGVLKIADFGMSTKEKSTYTNRVVTLWYRPPELLLGERKYTTAIDMWGAGCILAEMWTRSPIMQGQMQQHQLRLITEWCGSITQEVWPDVERLDLYKAIHLPKSERKVKERLHPVMKDEQAEDLVDKLLVLDPSKRFDSDMALRHPFFSSGPPPQELQAPTGSLSSSDLEHLAWP